MKAPQQLEQLRPKIDRLSFAAHLALFKTGRIECDLIFDAIESLCKAAGAPFTIENVLLGTGGLIAERKNILGKIREYTLLCSINSIPVSIRFEDSPIDEKDYSDFIDQGFWPHGKSVLAKHRSHFTVGELLWAEERDDAQLNYDRAVATTLAARALTDLGDVCGVLWHPAKSASPAESLTFVYDLMMVGMAPASLWVRFIDFSDEQTVRLATNGLHAFFRFEIEAEILGFDNRMGRILLYHIITDLFDGTWDKERQKKVRFLGEEKVWIGAEARPARVVQDTTALSIVILSDELAQRNS